VNRGDRRFQSVGPWRSWERASMASRRSWVRIPSAPPTNLLNQLRWSVFLVQSSPTIQQPSLHIHAANRQEHDCKCRVSRSGIPAFNHALPCPGPAIPLIVLQTNRLGIDPGKNCRVVFVTPTFWQSEPGRSNTANALPIWTVSYWIQRRNFFLRQAGAVLRLWY
jgi:hypothetical protein